jgi:hypothetical protein
LLGNGDSPAGASGRCRAHRLHWGADSIEPYRVNILDGGRIGAPPAISCRDAGVVVWAARFQDDRTGFWAVAQLDKLCRMKA